MASPWPEYEWARWNLPLARGRMAVVYVPVDWTPDDLAALGRYLDLFATTLPSADEPTLAPADASEAVRDV